MPLNLLQNLKMKVVGLINNSLGNFDFFCENYYDTRLYECLGKGLAGSRTYLFSKLNLYNITRHKFSVYYSCTFFD